MDIHDIKWVFKKTDEVINEGSTTGNMDYGYALKVLEIALFKSFYRDLLYALENIKWEC